ncbi:MAG TPA: hypothetical protein VF988_00615, partial [Verrucomicrobiae bacterium]
MKTNSQKTKILKFALPVLLAATSAMAANDTWNGASSTSGNWSDTANWGGSTVASGDLLFFGGVTRLVNTNNLSSFSFGGITFNSGSGAFSLTGNPCALTGGITNSSATGSAIGVSLTLGAGSHSINLASGNITNSATINGVDATSALQVIGSKTLVLAASNSFSGGLTVSPASGVGLVLSIGNSNALGAGTLTFSSG